MLAADLLRRVSGEFSVACRASRVDLRRVTSRTFVIVVGGFGDLKRRMPLIAAIPALSTEDYFFGCAS